jgi:hypothetical protein
MVLAARIVLFAGASARVPMVCCRYDAAALAALTALLVEGPLALLATRLLLRQWCSSSCAWRLASVISNGVGATVLGLTASSATVLVQWCS